jgi:hypothetical protein
MVVEGKGMNLRLAPQAAKGTGEDDAVVVLVEMRTPDLVGRQLSMTVALGGE